MTLEPATRTALALLAVASVAVAALAIPDERSPVAGATAPPASPGQSTPRDRRCGHGEP